MKQIVLYKRQHKTAVTQRNDNNKNKKQVWTWLGRFLGRVVELFLVVWQNKTEYEKEKFCFGTLNLWTVHTHSINGTELGQNLVAHRHNLQQKTKNSQKMKVCQIICQLCLLSFCCCCFSSSFKISRQSVFWLWQDGVFFFFFASFLLTFSRFRPLFHPL